MTAPLDPAPRIVIRTWDRADEHGFMELSGERHHRLRTWRYPKGGAMRR